MINNFHEIKSDYFTMSYFHWCSIFIFQFILVLLTIMEGREVTKLYFETGKISAGDRFYSLKYIIAPAFLLFFTFSFGIMISFIL